MSEYDVEKMGVLDSKEIPEDSLLGFLVGIVHHQFKMAQAPLEKIMTKAGLPEEYWPNQPRGLPSFQAACRKLESPRVREVVFKDPESKADLKFKVEYMVDVLNDGSRQLTRKIHYPESVIASPELKKILEVYVNTTQKEPEKMAKFIYDSKSDSITRINLYNTASELDIGSMTDEQYAKLIEEFNNIKKCYTERYLKDAWFRMLRREGAIPWLKNCGSLWFIPKTAKRVVSAFGEIYKAIHGEEGTWRSVPIINTEQHRKYLMEDIQIEYKDRFKSFLGNIAKTVESNMDESKRMELLKKHKDSFEESLRKELIDRYNNLLGMNISAKIKDIDVHFENSRLEAARKMMLRV